MFNEYEKSRSSTRSRFFAGHIANPISNCFALKQFANRVPRSATFQPLISQARLHFFPCKSRANGAQAIFPVVPTSFLVRLVVSPHRGNNGRAQEVGVGGFKGERRKHRGAGERNMAAENFMGVLWRQKEEKRERRAEASPFVVKLSESSFYTARFARFFPRTALSFLFYSLSSCYIIFPLSFSQHASRRPYREKKNGTFGPFDELRGCSQVVASIEIYFRQFIGAFMVHYD